MASQLIVAKAYLDQLARTSALPSDQLVALNKAVERAEKSKLSAKDRAELAKMADALGATKVSTPADTKRVEGLVSILKNPIA